MTSDQITSATMGAIIPCSYIVPSPYCGAIFRRVATIGNPPSFSGLKIKLIASIVAISGIHLLKIFMSLSNYTEQQLLWYVVIHMTFIFSGVAVAVMDWIEEKAHKLHDGG